MRDYTKRAVLVIVLGLVGLGVSLWTESLHRNLRADPSYTSFCHINSVFDCDPVLGSKWAELGGVSVALLAALYYVLVVTLGVAIAASRNATRRRQLADVLLAQTMGGLGFSLYMAGIAFGVLQTICLMCSALYVIAVLECVAVWRLRSALSVVGRRQAANRAAQDRMVALFGVGALLLLVGLIGWEVLSVEATPKSAADIRSSDPKFYDWYNSQPIVALEDSGRNDRGSATASVTIVEFSDFECAHCNSFHHALDEVWREQPQQVRVVFRHFPLDSDCNKAVNTRIHPGACFAAVAAECAGEQGRFWEYHNLLFRHQEQLDRESLLSYAQQLGLDSARFAECLQKPEVRAQVENDARKGAELGINSTPTIFINGRMIKGALDVADLRKALILARHPNP